MLYNKKSDFDEVGVRTDFFMYVAYQSLCKFDKIVRGKKYILILYLHQHNKKERSYCLCNIAIAKEI